jgi:hypothetical protein
MRFWTTGKINQQEQETSGEEVETPQRFLLEKAELHSTVANGPLCLDLEEPNQQEQEISVKETEALHQFLLEKEELHSTVGNALLCLIGEERNQSERAVLGQAPAGILKGKRYDIGGLMDHLVNQW